MFGCFQFANPRFGDVPFFTVAGGAGGFGSFIFAMPRFGDVPFFGNTPATGGGGGGGDSPRHRWRKKLSRRESEAMLEIQLLTFLNTQE